MFIELVDALRCPKPHEESWLVAQADIMHARHIVSGTLGCPVCSAQFPIQDGVVDFRLGASESHTTRTPDTRTPLDIDPLKLAALLDLSDHTGFALLIGHWGAAAHELSRLVETPLIAIDPPAHVIGAPGVSVIRSDNHLPLADRVARGAVMDERTTEAVRVVKPGGRIVAETSIQVPVGVTELARDQAMWVGERTAPADPLVALHVRRR